MKEPPDYIDDLSKSVDNIFQQCVDISISNFKETDIENLYYTEPTSKGGIFVYIKDNIVYI